MATLVASLKQQTEGSRELAVAIHDYVRDIPFGFTRQHDHASAEYTLQRRVGHCTPKAQLFVSLLREAGFEDATTVTVPISGDVLRYLGPQESSPFPTRLQHTFTKVTVEGKICCVDSYVVDPPLFGAARHRLSQQNVVAGWGIHKDGVNQWDGHSDAFSQYVPSTHTNGLESKQRLESTKAIVNSKDYLHQDLMFLLRIPLLGRFVVGSYLENANRPIQALRDTEEARVYSNQLSNPHGK